MGPGSTSVSAGVWDAMAEAGYDIGVGKAMVVRPNVGLGLAQFHQETCFSASGFPEQCTSFSKGTFAVAPGALFLAALGAFFVGGGLRYEHVFVSEGNGDDLLLHATGGLTF